MEARFVRMRERAVHGLTAALAMGTLMVTAACSNHESSSTGSAPNGVVNIANGQNMLQGTWQYMPGVTVAQDELIVKPTHEAILSFPDDAQPSQENSHYIANPPVNLFGTHLETENPGNFSIVANLRDIEKSATISFLSAPPVRYDENRLNQPGVDVTIAGKKINIVRWGEAGQKLSTEEFAVPGSDRDARVEVTELSGGVTVTVNNQELKHFGDSIFTNQVWFGLDGSFKVDSLEAYPTGNNKIRSVDMSQHSSYGATNRTIDGLAGLAKTSGHGDKAFGTAVDPTVLVSDVPYSKFIIQNFNGIEIENAAKPQALQPERGVFYFEELDGLVHFAELHNQQVTGHALVFNEANPKWLVDALATASPEEARVLMDDHITTIMSRYDGKHGHGTIDQWDVVNEPFDPDNWGALNKNNIWYKAIGPSYISDAIRYARRANPQAQLGINDWAMESDSDRRAGMISLLKNLADEHASPDYVGIQAHIDEDTLRDDSAVGQLLGSEQAEFMTQLDALHVKARYSEVSVADIGDKQLKADVNAAFVRNCLRASNCLGVNWWGATNQSGRDFYFTGDQTANDPGNDAPTTQQGLGNIQTGAVWQAIRRTVNRN
jgi:endo-1,4-beta-xylanase